MQGTSSKGIGLPNPAAAVAIRALGRSTAHRLCRQAPPHLHRHLEFRA